METEFTGEVMNSDVAQLISKVLATIKKEKSKGSGKLRKNLIFD